MKETIATPSAPAVDYADDRALAVEAGYEVR